MSESESVAIASASQPSSDNNNPPEVNVNNTSSENNVEGGESNGDNHVEEKENEEPKEIVATKVSGTVKWFNVKSGYGFINRNDTKEDVFVHQTAIQKNNPKKAVRSVGDGEIVEFDVVIGEKGNEASNVCGPEGAPVKGSPYAADRRRGTGFRRGRGGAEGAPAPGGRGGRGGARGGRGGRSENGDAGTGDDEPLSGGEEGEGGRGGRGRRFKNRSFRRGGTRAPGEGGDMGEDGGVSYWNSTDYSANRLSLKNVFFLSV